MPSVGHAATFLLIVDIAMYFRVSYAVAAVRDTEGNVM